MGIEDLRSHGRFRLWAAPLIVRSESNYQESAMRRFPPLDWEGIYRGEDIPWADDEPWPPLQALAEAHCPAGGTVLEIGCGLGIDAIHLTKLGYRVTAIDVSPTALERAIVNAEEAGAEIDFRVADFYRDDLGQRFDLVYDKGAMVNAEDQAMREDFARRVASVIGPDGKWISVSGTADNLNRDGTGIDKRGYPRLSLEELAQAVEPHFEIESATKEMFGSRPSNSFSSWLLVARPRRLPTRSS